MLQCRNESDFGLCYFKRDWNTKMELPLIHSSVDPLIQKQINGTTKDQRNIFFGNLMKKVNVPLIFFVHLLEILHLFLEKHCLTPLSFWILPSANLLPQPTLALNQTQTRAPCEAGALILTLPTMFWIQKKKDQRNIVRSTNNSQMKDQRMSRSTEVPILK